MDQPNAQQKRDKIFWPPFFNMYIVHTKFVVFAFFVCGMYTYEKCKIYKLRLHILKNGGQKILSLFFCAFGWSNFVYGAYIYFFQPKDFFF